MLSVSLSFSELRKNFGLLMCLCYPYEFIDIIVLLLLCCMDGVVVSYCFVSIIVFPKKFYAFEGFVIQPVGWIAHTFLSISSIQSCVASVAHQSCFLPCLSVTTLLVGFLEPEQSIQQSSCSYTLIYNKNTREEYSSNHMDHC